MPIPLIQHIIPITGIVLLITCISILAAPLFGWRFKYDAVDSPVAADIPKAGRYSFFLRRKRNIGLGWYGGKFKIIFTITALDTDTSIDTPQWGSQFTTSSGIRPNYDILRVGQFYAPTPGRYLIETQPGTQFKEKDKIIIKRYSNPLLKVPLVAVLAISPFMFTSGLAGGIISIAGPIIGILMIYAEL